MDEVLDFLKKNPTYYLATVDAQGNPQIRPFGTIAKIGDALYIETGKVKNCYKEMEAHPRISICTCTPDGSEWIRLECDVEPDDSVESCEAMLEEYPSLRNMYKAGDGNTVVMKLTNVKGSISSFTAEPKTFEF